jgi:hypothetical protein
MDRYWSYVATPLFFSVIGFGTYVLFQTQDIQFLDKRDIRDAVKDIRTAIVAQRPIAVASPGGPSPSRPPARSAGTPDLTTRAAAAADGATATRHPKNALVEV